MRCVHKSLVLSSNFVGISLNWPSVLGSTSSSTKKISFSLAFNAAHVSKLIGQRLVFKTLSAHPSSVLGVRLMWIISVCSLYVKLSIRASTEIMLLCAKSCIMMFGWCILLVSAVSVEKNKLCWYKVFTYDVYGCCCNNLKSQKRVLLFFFNQPPTGVG